MEFSNLIWFHHVRQKYSLAITNFCGLDFMKLILKINFHKKAKFIVLVTHHMVNLTLMNVYKSALDFHWLIYGILRCY